jgi:hypothetical protein
MYACIKDPQTGNNLYADVAMVRTETTTPNGDTLYKTERVEVLGVSTEEDFLNMVLFQLRRVTIKDSNLLKSILKDNLNISVDTCPHFVRMIQYKLNARQEAFA